jgi:hypothetical protein
MMLSLGKDGQCISQILEQVLAWWERNLPLAE